MRRASAASVWPCSGQVCGGSRKGLSAGVYTGRFVVGPGRGLSAGVYTGSSLPALSPAISSYLSWQPGFPSTTHNTLTHVRNLQNLTKPLKHRQHQLHFLKNIFIILQTGVIILSIMILTSDFRLSCIWFLQDLLRLWNVKPRTGKTTTFRRYSSANKPKVQEFSFLDMLWARSGLWLWDPTWDVMWFKPTNKYSGSRKPLYANANTEQSFKTFHRQFL